MRGLSAGTAILATIVVLLSAAACGEDEQSAPGADQPVYIDSIEPSSGTIGTELVIKGHGFDPTENDIGFTLPRSQASYDIAYQDGIPSADGETLRFELEDTLGACAMSQLGRDMACPAVGIPLPIDDLNVSVFNRNGTSNSIGFKREASPVEVAQTAVYASPAYQELTEFLDGLVGASYQTIGDYGVSTSVGFRESDSGDVYVEVEVYGAETSEWRDKIPSQIAGYEVRTN